ncbi:hypothetical protein NMG60_11024912 [Bertholletia excelsa]
MQLLSAESWVGNDIDGISLRDESKSRNLV